MKVKKINFKIRCDMYGCYGLSDFGVYTDTNTNVLNLCAACAEKLKNGLAACLKGEKNGKKE